MKNKIHSALDAAENPSESLDLSYDQQVQQLEKMRQGIADIARAKTRLRSESASLQKDSLECGTEVAEAWSANRNDQARLALSRQIETTQRLLNLLLQLENLEKQQEQLHDGERRLIAKFEAFRRPHIYKTGVVMGKFYPPHRGHKYLIDTAAGRVEHLTVLVCDTPGQTIPAELRASWLREIHPTVKVTVLDDRDDEADIGIWARNTIAVLGQAPDVVFSSEDYGDQYARLMGAVHVLVDRERRVAPCSGTAARADPLGTWECLEPCVRAHYAVRVCLVGAESTGKTTLAAALANHYHTIWVAEYGRAYTEEKVRRDPAEPWWSDEFVHIAAEQSRLEDLAARECNKVLICDTDAFATGIWHERYLGTQSAEVEAIAAPRRYALYILTGLEVPWVDDGTRDGEHFRQWMHGRFREELERRGLPVLLVSGSHEARLAAATARIDQVLDPSIENLISK